MVVCRFCRSKGSCRCIVWDCCSLVKLTVVYKSRLESTSWKVSSLYFLAFGLSLRIQSECGKIRSRKNSLFGHFSRSGEGRGMGTLGRRYKSVLVCRKLSCCVAKYQYGDGQSSVEVRMGKRYVLMLYLLFELTAKRFDLEIYWEWCCWYCLNLDWLKFVELKGYNDALFEHWELPFPTEFESQLGH